MKKLVNSTMIYAHYKMLALAICLFTIAGITHAQTGTVSADTGRQHSISLEIDPAPFVLGGYSYSFRYSNKHLPHWSIMASVFAADFPDGMLSKTNRNNGWKDVRFSCSKALFVDYHFKANGKGLFVGPSVFTYNSQAGNTSTGKTSSFKTVYPNLRVGYTWFPFKKTNLYVVPWLNMGKEFMVNHTDAAAGPRYQADNFKYILALHIGYKYSFDKLFQDKKANRNKGL